jgi:hypothetical protein
MNWWHRLLRRNLMEEQLEKELRFHLDQHTADLVEQGLDAGEARRQATLALGGPEQVKEQCRDARRTRWLEDLLHDIRYAARRLRGDPGFAAVSFITLALGIGASTAIFSAVNPILFERLPYPHADRDLMIWYANSDGSRSPQAFGTFREIAERSQSFEAIAALKPWQPTMTGGAEPERFDGQMVSARYFSALGVHPVLGREFDTSEDQLHGPKVAIISDTLWRRRFNSDSLIVGRQVTLDDEIYAVIGVMPRSFENVLAPSAEVWTPLQYDSSLPLDGREWGQHLRMVARLRAGVAVDEAKRELDTIAQEPIPDFVRHTGVSMAHG